MCKEAEAIAQELRIARTVLGKQLKKQKKALESGSNVSLSSELDIVQQQQYVRRLETELTRMRQPIITLDVQHDELMVGKPSRLQLTMHNKGYGPAHDLMIRISSDQFEERVTDNHPIATLQVGHERTTWLDVCPRAYGDNTPLQLRLEYTDHAGESRICERTIHLPVAPPSGPPVSKTTLVLPFGELSPANFERLCLWLVEREGFTRAEHLGLAGSEQGRDVVAYKPTQHGEGLWYFQCKRYRSINAKTLKDEVDKYLRLAEEKPHLRPAGAVFVISCAVSARIREAVGAYCKRYGLAYEFWALTELDMRVKRHPDLLQEFFNLTP